ncbi:MAG: oligosaccharide flippase family protein [Candidatus Sungbacteria bacterium]|nr:oligosaccharide flippase family protein [Candidatus Sungbacteria bacterium]
MSQFISEEKSESVGRAVARGVVISGSTNVILRFLEAAVAVLLLSRLSIFQYGAYQLTLSAFELFAGFFFAGLSSVIIADVSREAAGDNKFQANTLFGAYAYFQFAVSVFLWAVFFFGANLLTYWVGGETQLIRIVSFLFLASPAEQLLGLHLQIQLKFWWLNAYKILYMISRLGMLTTVFFLGLLDAKWAVVSLVFSSVAASLVVIPFVSFVSSIGAPQPMRRAKALFAVIKEHGKWAIVNDFIGNIGSSIRPFLIRIFVGVEAVAVFTVAQNFAGYLSSAFPIREVLSPIFPRQAHDAKALAATFNRVLKYSTLAFLLIAAAGAVAVPLFVKLAFPKYVLSLPYLFVYLFAMPLLGFRLAVTPLFAALKKQKLFFSITIYRTAVSAVLGALLIWLLGIWGAAFEASFGVSLLLLPVYTKALRRMLPDWKFSAREFFAFNQDDRRLASAIVRRLKPAFWR